MGPFRPPPSPHPGAVKSGTISRDCGTRAALGGQILPPLPYFLDSSQTTADIVAKLSVTYSSSI